MSSLTKVALVQMKMDADPKKNLSKAIEKIKLAKKKGAQIVCLPELFLTHYFCQEENHDNFAIAEKIPGKTTNTLCELAKKISVIIIVPLFEKKVSGLYHNSCVVIDEKGKIFGHYRKMHIPDDPQYYEKFY
ncbi:MAG: acyltransferase, partial [Proteobacteria bacterium]|nr:acyltransferase [Pseudomonadota bacterium]